MLLIAKVIMVSHAKCHCNRLTTVQDYVSLIFRLTLGFVSTMQVTGCDYYFERDLLQTP